MSPTESESDRPRKPRRRSAPAENQGPGSAHDHPPIPFAPMEQGGAAMGDDPAYASGASPADAAPPGPPSSADHELDAAIESDGDGSLVDSNERRQLVLVKNGHRYVFRYERGEETKVLAGLVDMARDPKSELDWFDAAVLSHQLGQRMSEQLDRLRRA